MQTQLEFRVDSDIEGAPPEFKQRWIQFRKIVISMRDYEETDIILSKWIEYSGKNYVLLDRCEGGIATGQCNVANKQIRVRGNFDCTSHYWDTISFDVMNSDNHRDTWTDEELHNLIKAFLKVTKDYLGTYCCKGYIKTRRLYDDGEI